MYGSLELGDGASASSEVHRHGIGCYWTGRGGARKIANLDHNRIKYIILERAVDRFVNVLKI